jgi:hypothetical protein
LVRANCDTSGDIGYHLNNRKSRVFSILGSEAHARLGHIADAFKDWRVRTFWGKASAASSPKVFTDLSRRRHLFRGKRRARFYFRIFAHDHQDVRIQSVVVPLLLSLANGFPQQTRLPSYSPYRPMLSQLSSSQSPPGRPTASSPADLSS